MTLPATMALLARRCWCAPLHDGIGSQVKILWLGWDATIVVISVLNVATLCTTTIRCNQNLVVLDMTNLIALRSCNISRASHLITTALEPRICVRCVVYCIRYTAVPMFIPVRKHAAKAILPHEPDLRLRCAVRADTAVDAATTTCRSREQTMPERPKDPAHHILSVSHIGSVYRGRYAAANKVQGSCVQSRERDPASRLSPHMSPQMTDHNHQVGLAQILRREMGSRSCTTRIYARWDAATFSCPPPTFPVIWFEMTSYGDRVR